MALTQLRSAPFGVEEENRRSVVAKSSYTKEALLGTFLRSAILFTEISLYADGKVILGWELRLCHLRDRFGLLLALWRGREQA